MPKMVKNSHKSLNRPPLAGNVIKLSPETPPGIKWTRNGMGKSPVPFVFLCKQGKSVQQTKRMEYPLKKFSWEPNYATL
jgi:hypothetical protein